MIIHKTSGDKIRIRLSPEFQGFLGGILFIFSVSLFLGTIFLGEERFIEILRLSVSLSSYVAGSLVILMVLAEIGICLLRRGYQKLTEYEKIKQIE